MFNIDVNQIEINDYLKFELIINCISNYYQKFKMKEKSAKYYIDLLSNKENSIIEYSKNYKINKINGMIEFYQIIFTGNFYLNFANYGYYLIKIMELCMKNNYLEILPYEPYLNNLLFILDYLYIRCGFIEKENLIEENEPKIITSIVELIFKYVTEFFGKIFSKVRQHNFNSIKNYEELLSLHIKILNKTLHFDFGTIKHSFPEVKENFISLFKNIKEVYDKSEFISLYNDINSLIEFLYYFDENKECINGQTKQLFFKDIMDKEIIEFNKMKSEDNEKKDTFLEKTIYFNIFTIIYKRTKNIRDSLNSSLNSTSILKVDLLYIRKYILKFTQILNILFNFLKDNKLDMFYDTKCSLFLKINSFICKTFKILYKEKVFEDFKKIYETNNEIITNFFTQFFFLLSILIINKNNNEQFDYNYKIAKNRNGFYFNEFKENFNKYFGLKDYQMMSDFLNILSKSFKDLCDDQDTLEAKDVDDNSIEIDKRDSCPICLEYTNENDVHLNICNHQYHLECLKKQISNNYTKCSLCKRPITGIKEDPNFKVISNVNINDNDNNYDTHPSSLFAPRNNIFLPNPFSVSSNDSLFSNIEGNRGGLFNPSRTENTGGLFGPSRNENTGSLFGTTNNRIGGGLFGSPNNVNASSLFGSPSNVNTGSLFGSPSNVNTGSLFGTTNYRRNNTNNNSLFGNNNQNNGLFGTINSNNNNIFGNNQRSRGLFG